MVGCVNSPTEFTEVWGCCWLRGYGRMPYPPNLCASVLSVGDSSLQETSVRSVGSVGIQSPTDFTDQHRWLVALIRPRNSQKFGGAVGCVGTAGCHTLLICAHLCASVGATSQPEGSVCSVRSVGDIPVCFVGAVLALTGGKVELRLLDSGGSVGMAGCHTLLICAHPCQSVEGTSLPEGSVCSVGSVGGASLPEGSVCSVRSVGDIPACFVGAVLALAVGNVELRLLDSEGSVGRQDAIPS